MLDLPLLAWLPETVLVPGERFITAEVLSIALCEAREVFGMKFEHLARERETLPEDGVRAGAPSALDHHG